MGILDGLMGNASEADLNAVAKDLELIITDEERVEKAFKIIRDLIVFTDKRLILIDKQGVTGKKVEYHSIPYRSVTHYSVETAGTFDMDAELKIYISGHSQPLSKQFRKDKSIYDVQRSLAKYVNQ
ncbi:PH domain-containing protein [Pseudalkalibacillus berkeleyi]|uniref:PH domain-containing protein n=1 Tax=Pseudalkalibacillus berkeleyi TaxID=1069813 RepID=A0ABS9H0G3_9BACL|nr:PH domain-containing protein [Pseudalkalibacillus berkeleyi]MCF6137399.1 PH domain-containing protein [Pseudalkalibacillus berkeleyi]